MPPANTSLQSELGEIKGRLSVLDDIKEAVEKLTIMLGNFREEYVKEHAVVVADVKRAHQRLDDHDKQLAEIAKLMPWVKAMAYVLTAIFLTVLGASITVLAWVWSLITHGGLMLP